MTQPAFRRVSSRGRTARVVVTVLALAGIVYGSVGGSNKFFPFGPMTQYAFYVPPDGVVKSTTVWADTTDGDYVHVRLDPQGVGVKRADVEAQLQEIVEDSSLLRTISTAQRRLHPEQPQYTKLYVVQTVYQLRDRVPVSHTRNVIATWTVQP